jgi:hypothetical protein
MKVLFFLVILISACSTSNKQLPKQEEECLNYEPQKVQLVGQLYEKSFPGPPNYEDINKGDEEEICWLIKTTKEFCVNEGDPDYGSEVHHQSEVQLVMTSAFDFYETKKSLLGQKVAVQGTLFPKMTGHHKTEVLITVESLERIINE